MAFTLGPQYMERSGNGQGYQVMGMRKICTLGHHTVEWRNLSPREVRPPRPPPPHTHTHVPRAGPLASLALALALCRWQVHSLVPRLYGGKVKQRLCFDAHACPSAKRALTHQPIRSRHYWHRASSPFSASDRLSLSSAIWVSR